MSNAFLVSFFFAHLSKCDRRSIQIIFSKKLCVNVVDGKVCINIQCYDLVSVLFHKSGFAATTIVAVVCQFASMRTLEF